MPGEYKKPRAKFTAARKDKFLAAYARTGLHYKSAKEAGVCGATVYDHKKSDPDFAAAYEEAREQANDLFEETAINRAIDGWDEVTHEETPDGPKTKVVRKFDNGLLTNLLKARRPATWRDNISVDANVSGGTLVVPVSLEDDGEVDKALTLLSRRQKEARNAA